MRRSTIRTLLAAATVVSFGACGGPGEAGDESDQEITLGPIDGRDLVATDLDRIQVGDPAPDFSLESYDDGVVTLSDFRGAKNVVLVFYRGHW